MPSTSSFSSIAYSYLPARISTGLNSEVIMSLIECFILPEVMVELQITISSSN